MPDKLQSRFFFNYFDGKTSLFWHHCSLKILELKGKRTVFVDDLKHFCARKSLHRSLAAICRYSLLKKM